MSLFNFFYQQPWNVNAEIFFAKSFDMKKGSGDVTRTDGPEAGGPTEQPKL
jgi:hypothetical protein